MAKKWIMVSLKYLIHFPPVVISSAVPFPSLVERPLRPERDWVGLLGAFLFLFYKMDSASIINLLLPPLYLKVFVKNDFFVFHQKLLF